MRIKPFLLYAAQLHHHGLRLDYKLFHRSSFPTRLCHSVIPSYSVSAVDAKPAQELSQIVDGSEKKADHVDPKKHNKAKKRQHFPPYVINEIDIVEKFARGGGPGGQSINKSMNKVLLYLLDIACRLL